MELDNPLFFQPASDLIRTPILLKIARDELFDFGSDLDGLGVVFMASFGQAIDLFVPVSPLPTIAADLLGEGALGSTYWLFGS